jgi:hypothetical protein
VSLCVWGVFELTDQIFNSLDKRWRSCSGRWTSWTRSRRDIMRRYSRARTRCVETNETRADLGH